MNQLDKIIYDILHESFYIDYYDASEDEINAIESILIEKTAKRPHDNMGFAEHMIHFRIQGYGFLGFNGRNFCSWDHANEKKKNRSITAEEFIGLSGIHVGNDIVSKAEFDSVF